MESNKDAYFLWHCFPLTIERSLTSSKSFIYLMEEDVGDYENNLVKGTRDRLI